MRGLVLLAALFVASCGDANLNPLAARQEAEDRAAREQAKAEYEAAQAKATAISQQEASGADSDAESEPASSTEELIAWKRLDTPVTADKIVDWTEAANHIGEFIGVEGTIVDTHNSGRACFLNYTTEWRDKFYLAILGSNMDDYPESPERYFLNKKVRVVGKVEMYRDRPQIVVESPRHITILD